MVGTGRFELPACRLGGGRSIHLSYVPILRREGPTTSSLPTFQTLSADIPAVLHALELDSFDRVIGGTDRGA